VFVAVERRIEVVRHCSELGDWELASAEPHHRLSGLVTRYAGYRERSPGIVRRREPAMAGVVVVVSFGPTIRHVDPAATGATGQTVTSFVAGPNAGWSLTEYVGVQHGIQVDLSALAARRLLGVSVESLAGRVVPLEDVLGRATAGLVERLTGAPGWEARFDALDSFLARRADDGPPVPPQVEHAFARLRRTRGRVKVETLVAETGWSRRHLIATFRANVGMTPGMLGRILRFRRAMRSLERGDGGLAQIALAAGYHDQAHLNRDFRIFAGGPPTDHLARRLPDGFGVSGAHPRTSHPASDPGWALAEEHTGRAEVTSFQDGQRRPCDPLGRRDQRQGGRPHGWR
jgi:AraC-like DNA-binding protein